MKKILFMLIAAMVLFTACNKNTDNPYVPPIDFSGNKKAADLIQADNEFAFDLMDEIIGSENEDNFMISPLSVAIALGMTYNGSEDDTKTAFEETLRLDGFTRPEINYIHKSLIEHLLKVDPKVTMEIANSIWLNNLFTFKQAFADTNAYYYDAEMRSLDFYSPSSVN